jgi:hypothetical protein
MDVAAAEEAARQGTEKKKSKSSPAIDKADLLPMEDRYKDDGSVTDSDLDNFSLRTGHTEVHAAVKPRANRETSEDMKDLVDDLQAGRGKTIALLLGAVILIGGIVFGMTFLGGGKDEKEDRTKACSDICVKSADWKHRDLYPDYTEEQRAADPMRDEIRDYCKKKCPTWPKERFECRLKSKDISAMKVCDQ